MRSKAQLRTHTLPCQKDSCHKETLPVLSSLRQLLQTRTVLLTTPLRTIWAEVLQQKCTLCPQHCRAARPCTRSLCSSREQTPSNIGLPVSISHPKTRAALTLRQVQVRALGRLPPWLPVLGNVGYPQTNKRRAQRGLSAAAFSSVHLMRLPCFISETNERHATLGGPRWGRD